MGQERSARTVVIGLGSIGLGIAPSLLRAGRSVSGYDSASGALADLGGAPALDAAEVARGSGATVEVAA